MKKLVQKLSEQELEVKMLALIGIRAATMCVEGGMVASALLWDLAHCDDGVMVRLMGVLVSFAIAFGSTMYIERLMLALHKIVKAGPQQRLPSTMVFLPVVTVGNFIASMILTGDASPLMIFAARYGLLLVLFVIITLHLAVGDEVEPIKFFQKRR